MAHSRTSDKDSRVIEQCSRGRRIRNCWFAPCIVAKDRGAIDTDSHKLANVIDGETSCIVPLGAAPCASKVARVFVNAITFPSTSGACTVTFYKSVIGGSDTALSAAIDIDAATAETAIDGVLVATAGVQDLIEGQEVYAIVAISATTSARSSGLCLGMEWIPKD